MTRRAPIIHNISQDRVRFRLNFTQEPSSPGVRRRPVTPEVGLDPQRQLDLCAVHKITAEAAWRIIEMSSDVAKYRNAAPAKLRVFERGEAPAAPAPASEAPPPAPVMLGAAAVEDPPPDADVSGATPEGAPTPPPLAPLSPGRAIIPAIDVGPIDITRAVFGQDAAPEAGGAQAISPEMADAQRTAKLALEGEIWQRLGEDPDAAAEDYAVVSNIVRGDLPEGVVDTTEAPGVLGPEESASSMDGDASERSVPSKDVTSADEDEAGSGTTKSAQPDASWQVAELLAYAEEHNIALHGAKQKPKVLRKIAEWRERGGA